MSGMVDFVFEISFLFPPCPDKSSARSVVISFGPKAITKKLTMFQQIQVHDFDKKF